ncbi:hypothetical protein ASG89_25780 [Paenibacillus sp. Soil766]|uniref:copper amine oxidase N-terminal domain-containing protein n=1 Tax=Paenibacillus sp. Soil766 TaxID=1736404 RepID=UPI00070E9563|nr:copper amine oxidase N-terminal domain-containing protein [Paenibacillus sp. Soil766]KRF01771.1 hypothetical protein ASG89_25780 [Paenibacillus sp. Soil766]
MSKVTTLLICLFLIFSGHVFAETPTNPSEKVEVILNHEPITEPKPVLIEDKTFVPMHSFFTTLGFEVNWDPKERTARVIDRHTRTFGLSFLVDASPIPVFYIPDKKADPLISIAILDDTPIMINDEVYIPLRSFSEIFAGELQWNEDDRTVSVLITTSDFSKIWKQLESHGTTEGNNSTSTHITQSAIPGMLPLDIKNNLETSFHFTFTQAKLLNGGEKYPSEFLMSGSVLLNDSEITLKCDLYGNLPDKVRLIALSVAGDSKEEVTRTALAYFASVATTPYDGSDTQVAKEWIENNTNNKREIRHTTISNVSFEISGGPNLRVLLIGVPLK